MYLRGDNKLVVAVRGSEKSDWIELAESTAPVSLGQWHYGAFSWRVESNELKINLCLDNIVFAEKKIASGAFIDFTGATTAVGGHNSGQYQMLGKLEQFAYYSKAFTDLELKDLYAKGRGASVKYTYKPDARLEKRSIKTGVSNTEIATTYEYDSGKVVNAKVSDTTTVKKITTNGKTINYTRDGNGNIETIIQDGKIIRYYYNELSELIREDNEVLNKTTIYSYDKGGNIKSKVEYPYTADKLGTVTNTYEYSYNAVWNDKLESIILNKDTANQEVTTITADEIGNTTAYDGWTFTWEHGRQLAGMSGSGKPTITFKYNDAGIRTQKVVDGVTTTYHLVGGKVTYEDNGTDKIYYSYDSSDHLISMNLSTKNADGTWTIGEEYFYIRNAQGDIIGLCDKSGAEVVSYSYDSFGKLTPSKAEMDDANDTDKNGVTGFLATTVGIKNPYLYRGYRFDSETGLYYLQSRYYNPNWGRFLNADAIIGSAGELLGHNVFAYCKNNFVNGKDPSGFISVPVTAGDDWEYEATPIAQNPVVLSAKIGGLDKAIGDITMDSVTTTPNKIYKTMGGNHATRRAYIRNIPKSQRNVEFIPSNFYGEFARYSSRVGVYNTVALGVGIYDNYTTYEDQSALIASGIDMTLVLGGIIALAFMPAATPLLAAAAGSMIMGAAVTYGAGIAKNALPLKKRH